MVYALKNIHFTHNELIFRFCGHWAICFIYGYIFQLCLKSKKINASLSYIKCSFIKYIILQCFNNIKNINKNRKLYGKMLSTNTNF